MNAEQLHAVCKELEAEITEKRLVARLKKLEKALQQVVSQPQQTQFQEEVVSERTGLTEALSDIETKERPVIKKAIIDEIGGTALLGGRLMERVDESFLQQGVTPSVVLSNVTNIRDELATFYSGLRELISAFEKFGIDADVLEPYTAEIGVLIPRRKDREDLEFFAKDILKLNRDLQPFHELVTGRSTKFRIRSMSSSDFSLFLDVPPETAATIIGVVWAVMHGYEKLLDIRIKRKELAEDGVPEDVLTKLDEWAGSLMSRVSDDIVTDLLEKHSDVDRTSGRENELRTHLRLSLKKIAGRLDIGYYFSARVSAPEAPDGEGEEQEGSQPEGVDGYSVRVKTVQSIRRDASKLEHSRMEGDPILPIDWRPEEQDDDDDD